MRLWHKDLIPVLPKQQLIGQWRECCLIAKNIAEKGTPNHLLVNRIMDYPIEHFFRYGIRIVNEMERRGYKVNLYKFTRWFYKLSAEREYEDIFNTWHNDRYLKQCYYNLQEKYDCGGITQAEWDTLQHIIKPLICGVFCCVKKPRR